MQAYIKSFSKISIKDLEEVGGKNSSLGEMHSQLAQAGVRIPDGFAITAGAFRYFVAFNRLDAALEEILSRLDRNSYSNLRETGDAARKLLLAGKMPENLEKEIRLAYAGLGNGLEPVAVRSSATAEDLPTASFAGQHESYLNISGANELVDAVRKCFASLYTDRAIRYREDNNFKHAQVFLSVGVQKMVRADQACSGVAFTLEPESGFRQVIHIAGVWGLGENLVQGTVNPDEFLVFKPALTRGKEAIIQKKLGKKEMTMKFSGDGHGVINQPTEPVMQDRFVITDEEVKQIATWCLQIEEHYDKPMDIEWAKDGSDGKIYIVQARPETVHTKKDLSMLTEYNLEEKGKELATGQAIGSKITHGRARIIQSPADAGELEEGDIVVTDLTSPDWDPILRRTAAIITNKGGRTSHASIVAREFDIPAIVGCGNATGTIREGQLITVSCCEGKTGYVYEGHVPFRKTAIDLSNVQLPELTRVMMILGDPEKAFKLSFLPNDGIGLLRMEFIITHLIRIHPMALVNFDTLKDEEARKTIADLTRLYDDKKEYFIDRLARGIATIAAAFYPRDVIVRMSDFKTNEYANLIGGKEYEPEEENPMIGFRGASRYYHPLYQEGFALECEAIKRVRKGMGFVNLKVMIPFCRTVEEGKKVIQEMKKNGLDRKTDPDLEFYLMVEIPSNVLLEEAFSEDFDGFSIGSNDLTQLTLGIDRDSSIIAGSFNERNPAPMALIKIAIEKAKRTGRKIGLCGQAPSDYPEFAQFLVKHGINSISFNPDALLKGIENINEAERKYYPKKTTTRTKSIFY